MAQSRTVSVLATQLPKTVKEFPKASLNMSWLMRVQLCHQYAPRNIVNLAIRVGKSKAPFRAYGISSGRERIEYSSKIKCLAFSSMALSPKLSQAWYGFYIVIFIVQKHAAWPPVSPHHKHGSPFANAIFRGTARISYIICNRHRRCKTQRTTPVGG